MVLSDCAAVQCEARAGVVIYAAAVTSRIVAQGDVAKREVPCVEYSAAIHGRMRVLQFHVAQLGLYASGHVQQVEVQPGGLQDHRRGTGAVFEARHHHVGRQVQRGAYCDEMWAASEERLGPEHDALDGRIESSFFKAVAYTARGSCVVTGVGDEAELVC